MTADGSHSPMGGHGTVVKTFAVDRLVAMYHEKCGLDVRRHFAGLHEITLYECDATGMRYWWPSSVAGDARFYEDISRLWARYYRTDRWEYAGARAAIPAPRSRVLEVGCGRGYFLRSLEPLGHDALGLELNEVAIANKVTRFEVRRQALEDLARAEPASFDAVCAFQVLEHLVEPRQFLESCRAILRPRGRIIVSTPNHEHPISANQRDPFDLPPHHVNHFTARTYARIADAMGLRLVSAQVQTSDPLAVAPGMSGFERGVREALNGVLRSFARRKRSDGRNLLAVFEKPA